MTLKTVDLDHTALTLEDLLLELSHENEVLLVRGAAPIARLLPVATEPIAPQRVFGLHEGQGWMSEDFAAPLPAALWLGE